MNRNHGIGNAGEFYVLAQLAQRGYIAAKTDEGQTLIDVIATDPETLNTVNIQVKTSQHAHATWWMMSKKNEAHYDSLFYVLVKLNGTDQQPSFFVFHSSDVGPWLKQDHAAWQAKPKRDGGQRVDGPLRKFRPTPEQLEAARDNWEALFV